MYTEVGERNNPILAQYLVYLKISDCDQKK